VKRAFDVLLAAALVVPLLGPALLIAALVKLTSAGPVLHWTERIGRGNRIFRMPKFRTMRVGTPVVATHLLRDARCYLTPVGSMLRRSSLDELPQLWSILAGNMSFVGPRPALSNQHDLIAQRTAVGIHTLVPGLTGWAQVNGRDDLSVTEKVGFDLQYLRRRSFRFDLRIMWLTLVAVVRRSGVTF
jgi:O-antigen biosynthesis protein WbqP